EIALRPVAVSLHGWTAAFLGHGDDPHSRLWAGLKESLARGSVREALLVGLDFAAILKEQGADDDDYGRLVAELSLLSRSGGIPTSDRNLLAGVLADAERGIATVAQICHAADSVAIRWTEPDLLGLEIAPSCCGTSAPSGASSATRPDRAWAAN